MTLLFRKATFHPWVGTLYQANRAYFGLRLLIMGESHYRTAECPADESQTTRWALSNGLDKHGFWRLLEGLLPTPDEDNAPRGWENVAFYNYVQHFVGDRSRVRPQPWMWTSEQTVSGLKEVLEVCTPDRVLVVGKDNWKRMAGGNELPENPPIPEPRFMLPASFRKKVDPDPAGCAYWYATGPDTYALCAPIFHPANPGGFHGEDTRKVVDQLLDKVWKFPAR